MNTENEKIAGTSIDTSNPSNSNKTSQLNLNDEDDEIAGTSIDTSNLPYSNKPSRLNLNDGDSIEIERDDDEQRILPSWFGDPHKDVLTAEHWLESVDRARDQFKWNEEVTMSHVVNALMEDSLLWFFDLVTY